MRVQYDLAVPINRRQSQAAAVQFFAKSLRLLFRPKAGAGFLNGYQRRPAPDILVKPHNVIVWQDTNAAHLKLLS